MSGKRGERGKGKGEKGKGKNYYQCPMPNDASCFKPGNPSNALAPQCPMPNAPCPLQDVPLSRLMLPQTLMELHQ
ncbi:hypothetical protein [Tolypothrix sp. VBCCA 56010]|uniref:hypothetical protein n=1 Tax=Tolypothrix sp. VBCCA 56010 TaxID=3137731 RepID=UPI003D7E562B